MSDYTSDVARWERDCEYTLDPGAPPDRNDYDEHGFKKGSVTYVGNLVLDNYLIRTYGLEYAMRSPLKRL